MRLFVLDFEASCLPSYGRSFPIEVGVCDVETGEVSSWLIRPDIAWRKWDWDPEAEQVHGLTRHRLQAEGRPASQIFFELADTVKGAGVVSDSSADAEWLMALCSAAGRAPPFEVGSMGELLETMLGSGDEARAKVESAQAKAMELFPVAHRAGEDARRLAEIIRLCRP